MIQGAKKSMKNSKKVATLGIHELEARLAPAPIWAGIAFPGKPNANAFAHANQNAAFFKFAPAE